MHRAGSARFFRCSSLADGLTPGGKRLATVRLLVHDTPTRQIELVVARPEIAGLMQQARTGRTLTAMVRNLAVRRAQVALPQEGVEVEALAATMTQQLRATNMDSLR